MLQNKVILTGNVGQDPEVKYLEGGSVVASLSLATSEKYKDKQGQKMEHTEWHNLVFWNEQAKLIEKYVKKGNKLQVEGKLRTRSYDKDNVRHYRTEIIVSEFLFLSPVPAASTPVNEGNKSVNADINQGNGPQDELSDLPF